MIAKRSSGRKAGATVEFAVVAPVLTLIVVGAVEFGAALMGRMTLDDAARQACRGAILPTGSNAQVAGDVASVLQAHNISDTATITVQVNGVTADASTAQQNDSISVQVGLPFSDFALGPAFFLGGTTLESRPIVMMRQR
jgi:Flp pilus assembly protein TadG